MLIPGSPTTNTAGPYRPAQWGKAPAMVMLTVPARTTAPTQTSQGGQFALVKSVTAQTSYVFDAVLEIDHEQRLEKTRHPVQTGADISSHAYLMPARCAMLVGMSDAMAPYVAVAQTQAPYAQPWTGNPSKSVAAYQQMLLLQAARVPLTVTTRLRIYTNMLITSISPREDFKTITGLRMRVEFEQILTGFVSTEPVSARVDATQSANLGVVNPVPVPASTQTQFQAPQAAASTPTPYPSWDVVSNFMNRVIGAGSYSSEPGQQALP